MASALADMSAAGAALIGAYGVGTYNAGGKPLPLAVGIAFFVMYNIALRHSAANPAARTTALALVMSLIVLSFVLHWVYLPAGVCCFFALMLQRSELLVPSPPKPAQKRQ